MPDVALGLPSWERTMTDVEKVKDRLLRASAALEKAGVAYAVIDGNAVATWVGKVDEAAVRFTRDVDILLRRQDLNAARAALEPAGFIYRHVRMIDMFLDGPVAKARDAVHVLFAGEKVRDSDECAAPDVMDAEATDSFRVVRLEALVRMKLTSYRDKDKTHLRDMIDVGLVDESWIERLPAGLGTRLQAILATPEG